jgi:branched-chain amino acid transport system substrate-binding protein
MRIDLLAAILLGGLSTLSLADINVGVTISATGPAVSLGIPEKNTIALMPQATLPPTRRRR